MSKESDELVQETAELIIHMIDTESIDGNWIQPWRTLFGSMPINATTNVMYRGFNILALNASAMQKELDGASIWATERQWRNAGLELFDAERGHSTPGIKWGVSYECECGHRNQRPCPDANDPGHYQKTRFWSSLFNVYHWTQVDGYEPPIPDADYDVYGECEEFVNRLGVDVTSIYGDEAAYSRTKDRIVIPDHAQFDQQDSYYATLFHELGHWTGHPSRLDRDPEQLFKDHPRAGEELIAEFTSAFLSSYFGLDITDAHVESIAAGQHANNVRYLQGWRSMLSDDPRTLYRAAKHAQVAFDYLLEMGLPGDDE